MAKYRRTAVHHLNRGHALSSSARDSFPLESCQAPTGGVLTRPEVGGTPVSARNVEYKVSTSRTIARQLDLVRMRSFARVPNLARRASSASRRTMASVTSQGVPGVIPDGTSIHVSRSPRAVVTMGVPQRQASRNVIGNPVKLGVA